MRRAPVWQSLIVGATSLLAVTCGAQPVSTGTGFFISPDGNIATSFHVIEGSTNIQVRDADGEVRQARVVVKDATNDLAILKVSGGSFPYLSIRRSSEVRKGEEVVVLGFPNIGMQGPDAKVTQGIISASSGIMGEPNSFQISTPVQPGNSGGPLLDRSGNVVGVVSAKLDARSALRVSGALPENVNYAVKSNYLLELISTGNRIATKIAPPQVKQSQESLASLVERAERAIVLIVAAQPADSTTSSAARGQSPPASTGAGQPSPSRPKTDSPSASMAREQPLSVPPRCSGSPVTCGPYRNLGEPCASSIDCALQLVCTSGRCTRYKSSSTTSSPPATLAEKAREAGCVNKPMWLAGDTYRCTNENGAFMYFNVPG